MKLILSSCDFRNVNSEKIIHHNLPKPIEECRLLFIPNEADGAYSVYALTDNDSIVIDKESL